MDNLAHYLKKMHKLNSKQVTFVRVDFPTKPLTFKGEHPAFISIRSDFQVIKETCDILTYATSYNFQMSPSKVIKENKAPLTIKMSHCQLCSSILKLPLPFCYYRLLRLCANAYSHVNKQA